MGAQLAGSARFSILDKYVNKEFSSQNRATALSTLNMGVSLIDGYRDLFWRQNSRNL
jgi:hypothetical protein